MDYIRKYVTNLKDLIQYKNLIQEFTKRDFLQRYKGSYLGMIWALISPLVMLAVYSFIFIIVFQNKWGEVGVDSDATYTLMIFSGLVPFYIFSETINRSLGVVVGNPNYVKKVVIPVEILPISVTLSTVINQLFGLGLLVLGKIIFIDTNHRTLLLVPLILLPIVVVSLGCSFIFSALGVYIRDMAHAVALILNILFYMSPIFYPSTQVPEQFKFVMKFNPLAPIIDMWREVIIKGTPFDGTMYFQYMCGATVFLIFGLGVFYYLRKGFADVI